MRKLTDEKPQFPIEASQPPRKKMLAKRTKALAIFNTRSLPICLPIKERALDLESYGTDKEYKRSSDA